MKHPINNICLVVAALAVLVACGDEDNYRIGDQDKRFIESIKQRLKKRGTAVRVADIYGGLWEKVCIHPIGSHASIEVEHVVDAAQDDDKTKIINGPTSTYANDKIWGIYFEYPENSVAYYRIPVNEMTGHVQRGGSSCVDRDIAVFLVTNDAETLKERVMQAKKVGAWSDVPANEPVNDFIEVELQSERRVDGAYTIP